MADVIVGMASKQTRLRLPSGKLVPSHPRQRVEFELGSFESPEFRHPKRFLNYKDDRTRRPSVRKIKAA